MSHEATALDTIDAGLGTGLDAGLDDVAVEDRVVLLDDAHRPIGSAPRESVHGTDTPLHLAYSCWVLDDAGRLLLTRRALAKRSWPGVWTNAFCGHPRPGEELTAAVARGAAHELGTDVTDIAPLLPDFRYRAVDSAGIVENEFCPVFTARAVGEVDLHPDEAVEHQWLTIPALRAALTSAPWALSPWLREQAARLDDRAWSSLGDREVRS